MFDFVVKASFRSTWVGEWRAVVNIVMNGLFRVIPCLGDTMSVIVLSMKKQYENTTSECLRVCDRYHCI